MNVGNFVWNVTNGLLRFGTVTRKEERGCGWAYYRVDWHDDVQYESAVTKGGMDNQEWYRIDELYCTDVYHLERSTYLHRQPNSKHGGRVRKNIPL